MHYLPIKFALGALRVFIYLVILFYFAFFFKMATAALPGWEDYVFEDFLVFFIHFLFVYFTIFFKMARDGKTTCFEDFFIFFRSFF